MFATLPHNIGYGEPPVVAPVFGDHAALDSLARVPPDVAQVPLQHRLGPYLNLPERRPKWAMFKQLRAILPENAKTKSGGEFKDKCLRTAAWAALLRRAEQERDIIASMGAHDKVAAWNQAIETAKHSYSEEIDARSHSFLQQQRQQTVMDSWVHVKAHAAPSTMAPVLPLDDTLPVGGEDAERVPSHSAYDETAFIPIIDVDLDEDDEKAFMPVIDVDMDEDETLALPASPALALHLPLEILVAVINAEVSGQPSMWIPEAVLPDLCGSSLNSVKAALQEGRAHGSLQLAGTFVRVAPLTMGQLPGRGIHQRFIAVLKALSSETFPWVPVAAVEDFALASGLLKPEDFSKAGNDFVQLQWIETARIQNFPMLRHMRRSDDAAMALHFLSAF